MRVGKEDEQVIRHFPVGPDGRWLEPAESLDHAKTRIHELGVSSPGEFLLLDHKTGDKQVINPNQARGR